MTPLAFDLGSSEIIIIVLIAVVLFGGTRLAGLGKSAGRAIREFKEETSGITSTSDEPAAETRPDAGTADATRPAAGTADATRPAAPPDAADPARRSA